ncbi:MAG: ABC transporter substrate-binding protein, partial [Gaiellaceae bacterium]
ITGASSDDASLDTALATAGLGRKDVKVVSVGYNLLPALLAHKVDAVIGVYRNVEGVELMERGFEATIIPLDRAGIPSYDELVLVANANRIRTDPAYRDTVNRFVRAFLLGTSKARGDLHGALAILRKVTASDSHFLARATPATLALLSGPRGVGCISPARWQRFGAWMHSRRLLKGAIPASAVMTTRFLPTRCTRR